MKIIKKGFSLICILAASNSFAATYSLPNENESLVGSRQYTVTTNSDTSVTLAKRYDLGHNALEKANPHLDMNKNLAQGAGVVLPTEHLLPGQARKGIVVNLPEMRMYYYPAGSNIVKTYPIGIGKIGKTIPIKEAVVTRKAKDPIWIPTPAIRAFNLEQGVTLPTVVKPGPENPLGPYAIYMSIPTYLMHSTIFPESIGKRASFGCIRMFEEDITEFFPSVDKGIPVAIINMPNKLGWQQNRLYLEAHQPLEEHKTSDNALPSMVKMISDKTDKQDMLIDWQLVSYIAKQPDGMPHEIGIKLQP